MNEKLQAARKLDEKNIKKEYDRQSEAGYTLDDVITVERWRGNLIEENRFFSGQIDENDLRKFQRSPNLIRQLWPKPDFDINKMAK